MVHNVSIQNKIWISEWNFFWIFAFLHQYFYEIVIKIGSHALDLRIYFGDQAKI